MKRLSYFAAAGLFAAILGATPVSAQQGGGNGNGNNNPGNNSGGSSCTQTTTGDGGIPRPVQRPIPIWIGGRSDAAMQRAARLADGWMPLFPAPDEQARARVDAFRACTVDAGRLLDEVGLEVWGPLAGMAESDWPAHAAGWR